MHTSDPKHMTENMSRSGNQALADNDQQRPQQGERFRCSQCGMEIEVTQSCHCEDHMVHFQGCGMPLSKE